MIKLQNQMDTPGKVSATCYLEPCHPKQEIITYLDLKSLFGVGLIVDTIQYQMKPHQNLSQNVGHHHGEECAKLFLEMIIGVKVLGKYNQKATLI